MEGHYITRKEAVDVLDELINSGILSEEIEEELSDICSCIRHEEDGLFLWGAGADAMELFIATREDLITDDLRERMDALYEKYRIREPEEPNIDD